MKLWSILGGLLLMVSGISAAFVFVHKRSYDHGLKSCEIIHTQEALKAMEAQQKAMMEAFYDLQKYEDQLNSIPASDVRPSDPLIRNHYRLRQSVSP